MMTGQSFRFLVFVGLLLASQAAHWFIGGRGVDATESRNIAVLAQLVVGVVLAVWAWWQGRRTKLPG